MFKRHIEVFLVASGISDEHLTDRTAVVIDVLRASTTIVGALHAGAREVIPVASRGEAGRMASVLDAESYVLGGEVGGVHIEGFHLGNSPRQYTRETVSDKTVILSTTNGTPTVRAAEAAEDTLIAGFVNAQAVAAAIQQADRDVAIVCSGWENRVSLEDTLCAGLLVELLLDGASGTELSDPAFIALSQYRQHAHKLEETVGRCNHARRLVDLGQAADIPLCLARDVWPVVPHLRESRLVLQQAIRPDLSLAEQAP